MEMGRSNGGKTMHAIFRYMINMKKNVSVAIDSRKSRRENVRREFVSQTIFGFSNKFDIRMAAYEYGIRIADTREFSHLQEIFREY